MTELPKGFYTGPDGLERFWDGEEWFDSKKEPVLAPTKTPMIKRFKAITKKQKILFISALAVVAIAIGASSVIAVGNHNSAVAAEQLALEQQQKRDAAAAAQEVATAAAEEADLERRRDNRKELVTEIQASIKVMAEEHVAEGLMDGPIISVDCATTGGISIEDITIRSMLFECFAANLDNGDGTLSGFYYNARANWDDGSYTYGRGKG
jgi:hypothetical protein